MARVGKSVPSGEPYGAAPCPPVVAEELIEPWTLVGQDWTNTLPESSWWVGECVSCYLNAPAGKAVWKSALTPHRTVATRCPPGTLDPNRHGEQSGQYGEQRRRSAVTAGSGRSASLEGVQRAHAAGRRPGPAACRPGTWRTNIAARARRRDGRRRRLCPTPPGRPGTGRAGARHAARRAERVPAQPPAPPAAARRGPARAGTRSARRAESVLRRRHHGPARVSSSCGPTANSCDGDAPGGGAAAGPPEGAGAAGSAAAAPREPGWASSPVAAGRADPGQGAQRAGACPRTWLDGSPRVSSSPRSTLRQAFP